MIIFSTFGYGNKNYMTYCWGKNQSCFSFTEPTDNSGTFSAYDGLMFCASRNTDRIHLYTKVSTRLLSVALSKFAIPVGFFSILAFYL